PSVHLPHPALRASEDRTSTPTSTPTPSSSSLPRLLVRDLHCDDARGRPALRGLSFRVEAGEVLGIAGVDGNGQSELAEVLTGLRRPRGVLQLDGQQGLGPRGWARSPGAARKDRKSTRLNSSHQIISYAVFCL